MNSCPWRRLLAGALALLGLLGNAGCIKSLRHHHDLARADEEIAKDDYGKAESDLIKAVHLQPHDAATLRRLGQLYVEEGRDLYASSAYRESVKWEPGNVEAQLAWGNALLRLHQLPEAHRVAAELLAKAPDTDDAVLLLLRSVRNSVEFQEARAKIEDSLSKRPSSAVLHEANGLALLMAGDVGSASAEFTAAIAAAPQSPNAYADRGELLLRARHDLPGALLDFKAATERAPLRSPWRAQYAEALGQSGQADAAKQLVADWLRQAPDYVPAEVLQMRIEFGDKRYDACIELARRVLLADPVNHEALGLRGQAKLAKGDTNGAIDDMQQAVGIFAHAPTIKVELAQAYLHKGDLASAAGVLNRALVDQSDYFPAVLLLAQIEVRQNQSAAAIELLKPTLKLKPPSAEAELLLGRAYLKQGDPTGASAVFRKMADDFPKDARPLMLLGSVEYGRHDTSACRQSLIAAIARDPGYLPAYQQLVGLDLFEGRRSEAKSEIAQLRARQPQSAFPWLLQSEVDGLAKDIPAAEADLRRAILLDPKFETAYISLAKLYLANHETAKALDDLTTLANSTDSRIALDLVGEVHQQRGEIPAAIESFERLLKEHPDDLAAANNLAYLYAGARHQLERATALARVARQLAPDNGNVADTAGWVEYRRRNYREALALFSEAVERLPADPAIRFHLGLADYMLGDEPAARTQFALALAGADFDQRREAERRQALLSLDPTAPTAAARAELERAAADDAGDPVAATRLAALDAAAGKAAAAIQRLEAALAANPGDGPLMLQLAELELAQPNGLARASALAEQAHAIMPNDPRVDRTLGLLLYRNGDYARALDELNLARGDGPGDPAAAAALARDLFALGRDGEARAMAENAPASSPVGVLLRGAGSPAAAVSAQGAARGAQAADPSDPLPALVLAAALEVSDPGAARAAYEEIYVRSANYRPVVYALDRLHAADGDSDPDAYDFATKAHRAWPEDPLLGKYAGEAMYRRGDYTNAEPLLQTVRRSRGNDAEVALFLGLTYFRLNDAASAKAELQRALKLELPEAEAAEARGALSGLDEGAKASADPSLSSVPLN